MDAVDLFVYVTDLYGWIYGEKGIARVDALYVTLHTFVGRSSSKRSARS